MNFIGFLKKVFEPKLHSLFALLWSGSLLAVLYSQLGVDRAVYLKVELIIIPISFFMVLLFLRMVDEIKDFDYDKVYKPDRPLVTGMVSFREIKLYCFYIAMTVLLLNLFLDWRSSLCLLAIMGYGLFLLVLESRSNIIRENVFLNLLVTFPVSSALNFYVLSYIVWAEGYRFEFDMLGIVIAYIAVFLHFEFGRKTTWTELLQKGENVYALHIGGWGSSLLAQFLYAIGATILAYSTEESQAAGVLFLPLFLTVIATVLLVKNRHKRINLYPFYGGALLLFYTIVLWRALN